MLLVMQVGNVIMKSLSAETFFVIMIRKLLY